LTEADINPGQPSNPFLLGAFVLRDL